jgi:hypothetical protein
VAHLAHGMCRKCVGMRMTHEAGVGSTLLEKPKFELYMQARGDFDQNVVGGARMIGLRSFNRRNHRLNGLIIAARGCTSRTFRRARVATSMRLISVVLDRLSS